MATYKVLQDIEAEDTLVGPLTWRMSAYAGISLVAGYLTFLVIAKGAPFLAIFTLPFVAAGAFFAFPWTKHQSTEVWALAKIRFYLKPRIRIWNQSGVKQLVTITAPRRSATRQRRNLSPDEVQTRLHALADTIDSRGWAVKNIGLGYYSQSSLLNGADSERLVSPTDMPSEVPSLTADASDIFDTASNPIAQNFDTLMTRASGEHHQQLVQQMIHPQQAQQKAGAAPVTQYWHMKTIQPLHAANMIGQATVPQVAERAPSATTQQPAPSITAMLNSLSTAPDAPKEQSQPAAPPAYSTPHGQPAAPRYRPSYYANMQVSSGRQASAQQQNPDPATTDMTATDQTTTQPVTDHPNPAILELANNNDLNVATIAREAQRTAEQSDEVVISLH